MFGEGVIDGQVPADLSILLSAPQQAQINVNFSYAVTVTGPTTASGVTVTDILPPGVNFISSGSSSGCTAQGGTVTCYPVSLSTGAASLTIVVNPTALGTVMNVVGVAGNEYDSNPANNTARFTTTVVSGPVPTSTPTPVGPTPTKTPTPTAMKTPTPTSTPTPTPGGVVLVSIGFKAVVNVNDSVPGTVNLSGNAPPGGIVVDLSSDNPSVADVDRESTTVPAGSNQGTFNINANTTGTANISASYAGVIKTKQITVNGPPAPPPGGPTPTPTP